LRRRYKYKLARSWRKAKWAFAFTCLWLGPILSAQEPHFVSPPINELLTDEQIQVIFESSKGHIWLGTNEGVFRYDGVDYQPYTKQEVAQNGSQRVTCFFESSDHRIWVGFQDGSIYLSTSNHQLLPWEPGRAISTEIRGMAQYQDQLLIATYGQGLFLFDQDSTRQYTTEQGLFGDDIYDLVLSEKDGTALLATDRGINRISLGEQPADRVERISKAEGLGSYVIRSIEPDYSGGYYLGTYDNGVIYWSPQEKRAYPLIENWDYGIINQLCLFKDRELWIGTDRKGLIQYQLKPKKHRVYEEINALSAGKIFDLLKDQEGNLWVVSSSFKLVKANRHFDFLEKLPEVIQEMQALWQDQDKRLWIGTENGIYTLTFDESGQANYRRKLGRIQSNILSFYEDQFGNIWIGTFGEGLYVYNEDRNKLRHLTTEDGLTGGNVLSMDGSGENIWVGSLAGVTQFSAHVNILDTQDPVYEQFDDADELNAAFIYKVFSDSKDRTWLGTDGEGLYAIQNNELNYYPGTDSLKFSAVYSIAEDKLGHIWFTSLNQGLFRFNGTEFQQFGREDGLRNLNITSLTSDGDGNVLILYPSGIDVLDPASLEVIYYDEKVGIGNLEQNLNVFCSDGNGDVWIGAKNNLLKYRSPGESFRTRPQLSLDQINVSGENIDPSEGQRRFSYRQNTFVFSFSGIWLTAPEEIQYRYQLEGLDEDWLYTRDQEVNYVNLPPGRYTFQASATANKNYAPEQVLTYPFTIRRPFWGTFWFIALAVILLTAALVFFLRLREKRIMMASRLKREKIESQFEALKSQINPHFLFNSFNTLVAIIEENPDNAVSYVERLSDFYRSILQYRNKTVIPLEEEITVVRNYFYLLKERFGSNLKLAISVNEKEAYIPPLSLQLLVENAIKHNIVSSYRPLLISIQQEDSGHLTVKNTLQPKRVKSRSTSFGLSSIMARYALLSDRKVSVRQTKQEFIVRLPLIKSEFGMEDRPGLPPYTEPDSSVISKAPQS